MTTPDQLRHLFPVATLEEIEAFEERAAIREYDGKLSRPVAEAAAVEEIERKRGKK